MTVGTASPSVFDAGLLTLDYDVTATPQQIYPHLSSARRQAPIALGPLGPEVLSYALVRAVLRDNRFQIPPGYILAVVCKLSCSANSLDTSERHVGVLTLVYKTGRANKDD